MPEQSDKLVTFLKGENPYTTELAARLAPFVAFTTWPAGKLFPFQLDDKKYCYLIRHGEVQLFREPDRLLMLVIQGPILIGGSTLLAGEMDIHIFTTEESEIAVLSIDELNDLLSKEGLWEMFAKHLQIIMNKLLVHTTNLTAINAYAIIRMQLIELMKESESFRSKTTAEKYIRSKTRLSRSGIMRMLSELKTGGYIEVENGILKKIKHLPGKY